MSRRAKQKPPRTASHRPAVRPRRFRHDNLIAVDCFCVDGQTEILTTAGWKRYDELAVGDIALTIRPDGSAAEWQPVEAVHVFPAGQRKMQLIEGRGISALTTDNHHWLSNHRAKTPEGRDYRWRFVRSDKLTCEDRIPMSAPVANLPTEPTVPDELVELVAWYWTEGTDRISGRVHIYQDHTVNPQHVEAIRSALVELFGPEREKRKRPDGPLWAENRWGNQTTFGLNRAAAAALRKAAPDKVPSIGWLTTLTQQQLDLFIQRSLDADGHERTRAGGRVERVLAQADRERASAFQAACLIAGRAASMKRYASTYRHGDTVRETVLWAVTVGMREFVKPLRQKRVEWVEHDGIVWCPTTPHGTWLARRDGTCYFTGNSGFGGLTRGIEEAGFTTILAANHNQYKVEVHEKNHPHAEHWIADLVDKDSSDYHSVQDLPPADLLVAGVSCFAAGSLVLTRRGLVPIQDVVVGDEVWTHRSRWRPVTHTSAVERPTVTVNATTAITCTPDHPFVAAQAARDYQPRRKYQALDGARCLECGAPAPRFRATNTARLFCSRKCSQADASKRALPVLAEPREVRADSLAGHWVASPILASGDSDMPVIDGLGIVTADVAWVLGRWVGDGWVSRRPERHNVWSRVTICAGHAESDALAKELQARTSLPWNRKRHRTSDTFHVTRRGLADFVADNFGYGAAGKRLPSWLLFAPEPIRRAFVDGYLSADGHVSRDGLRVQSMSVSKQLAVGFRLLLTSLGYYATVHYGVPKPLAVIEGRTVRQRPRWTVTGYLTRHRRPKHRDVDGFRWGAASGSVTSGETVTVYNMTVAEDHTYVVDGVLVHNCVNHSQANTQKAYQLGLALFDLHDPEFEERATRSEKDRATATCALQYAAKHHPRMALIECTTELYSWGPQVPGKKYGDGSTYRWWLKQWENEGYAFRILYLNSMFFGVPQSRDRWYGIFWDKRMPAPDLDHRPESWCGFCGTIVQAVWTWKTGIPPTGSVRYSKQYEYRCPSCRRIVIPPFAPSINALDLSNLGPKIGDRPLKEFKDKKTGEIVMSPLAPSTMARAERCRQKFADFPAVLMPAKAERGAERHPWQPLTTQTSQQETAVLSTGALIAAAGNTFERPGSDCRTRTLDEPLPSQTATNTQALLTPPVSMVTGQVMVAHRHNGDGQHITEPMDTVTTTHEKAILLAVNNFQGAPRGVDEVLPTQGGSETLGLLSAGVVPFRKNTLPTSQSEAMPTVTSDQIPGLLTAAGLVQFNQGTDRRVSGVDQPLKTVIADNTMALMFSGWYKENGKTAPHPASDPLGTVTAHDTTALLHARWREVLADLKLEDCHFRMMGPHEVGVGCGFDVDFGDHKGTFIVWGSARDQIDGFGNAVSPAVGKWIGLRLRAVLDPMCAA